MTGDFNIVNGTAASLSGSLTSIGTIQSTWPQSQTWTGTNWDLVRQGLAWGPSPEDQRRQQEAQDVYQRWAQQQQQASQRLQAPVPKVEEKKPVRGLFEVFVVNPESSEILAHETVVADNEKKAELKVLRFATEVDDPDDVDIIVRRLGDVRQKRQVQEVKVIKG